jgi:hypothetical protein
MNSSEKAPSHRPRSTKRFRTTERVYVPTRFRLPRLPSEAPPSVGSHRAAMIGAAEPTSERAICGNIGCLISRSLGYDLHEIPVGIAQ